MPLQRNFPLFEDDAVVFQFLQRWLVDLGVHGSNDAPQGDRTLQNKIRPDCGGKSRGHSDGAVTSRLSVMDERGEDASRLRSEDYLVFVTHDEQVSFILAEAELSGEEIEADRERLERFQLGKPESERTVSITGKRTGCCEDNPVYAENNGTHEGRSR